MNIVEISNKFPNELDAIKHFENVRWGKNFVCPFCKSDKIGQRNIDHRFHCKTCQKSFSVTTNTNLHNTRLPLKTWMFAFGVVADAKKGLSAKQLERNLGIHYETAWTIYHKIRELMTIENLNTQLDYIVEMDEKYVGGKPRKCSPNYNPTAKFIPEYDKKIDELKSDFEFKTGKYQKTCNFEKQKRGRGTKNIPVVGIVERDGNVVAKVMENLTYANLKSMVEKYVDIDESVLLTDEYKGYSKIHSIIEHIKIDHNKLYSYRGINTNSIESFWAIVERGITGQYHKVSLKYLPNYVAEFVFKFNNRKNDDMFETLVKFSMMSGIPKKRTITTNPDLEIIKERRKKLLPEKTKSKPTIKKSVKKTIVKPKKVKK